MFVEKPSAEAAKKIISKGALWNTLVLVAACKTLLQAIKHATPELYRSFEPIQAAIGMPDEERVTERVYQELPSLNFSKGVLENLSYKERPNLQVLSVRGVTWKDWGSSERLARTLRQLGAPDLVTPQSVVSEERTLPVSGEKNPAVPEEFTDA
jgi:mannose-1-phosphate guanylyltransferase